MLPIACHASAYPQYSLEQTIGIIARLGFRHIDLMTGNHIDVMDAARHPQQEATRIRHLLEKFNLTLTDLYLWFPRINDPEPAIREEHILEIERLIPFAVELGTPGITISAGQLHSDGPEHSLARSIPALQRIMDSTEDTDLRISIEPALDSAATTPEQCLLLLDAVPGLSLTLDIAAFIAQQTGWRDLRKLFEYTAHVQLRQARPEYIQTDTRKGKLEVERILNELVKSGYHDVLCIEYLPDSGTENIMDVEVTAEIVALRDALVLTRHVLQTGV